MMILIANGTPTTFRDDRLMIMAIKRLIKSGTPFQVTNNPLKSELPKFYGFIYEDKFIERLSVQNLNDNLKIWNCHVFNYDNGIISGTPEPTTIVSMMAGTKKKKESVFVYEGEQFPTRMLSVHALEVRG